MKTYVITLSRRFPKTHARAGEPTEFAEKFRDTKLHTIRANYDLWSKRIAEIGQGKACLSVRQWTGAPYRSKQVEIARLSKDDGVGIQKLEFYPNCDGKFTLGNFSIDGYFIFDTEALAKNDGLSLEDWMEWFKGYDLCRPLAIIQFTWFRYI